MTVSMKPNFDDPLDLIKNQHCTSDDVYGWLHEAINESRQAREDQKDAVGEDAENVRLRAETWSEAIDRLQKQYEMMTSGKA